MLTVNPDLRTVRSPYGVGSPYLADPADAEVELVAMPALHLDAAIVHVNRADTAGNGQILGPDPFFDTLFLGAAERRFVTAERIVPNGELADEAHPLSTVPIHRMLTDGVAEAPGGAHFTANPPDYGRDEAFQKEYAAAAADPAEWEAFAGRYVFVRRRRVPGPRAGAAGPMSDLTRTGRRRRDPRRVLRHRLRGRLARRRRGHGEPLRHHSLARRPPGQAHLRARPRPHRRRGRAHGRCAADRHPSRPSSYARRPCRTAACSTWCGPAGVTS